MKTIFTVAAAAACVWSASAAAATTVFGPKAYVVEAGKPQVFRESLTLDPTTACDAATVAFTLNVTNGDAGGRNGVASAVVAVNGAIVISERDFPLAGASVEVALAPASSVDLVVQFKGGRPGSAVQVSVNKRVLHEVHASTFVLNRGGSQSFRQTFESVLDGGTFVLAIRNGRSDGSGRVARGVVQLNGVTVVPDAAPERLRSPAYVPVSLLASNVLEVETTGSSGDELLVAVYRELDERQCGLRVELSAPLADAVIRTPTFLVSGTLRGTREAGVSVNDSLAEIDYAHEGSAQDPFQWFAQLDCEAGELNLAVVATDPRGRRAHTERKVLCAPSADHLRLDAAPRSGVAPVNVTFHLPLVLDRTIAVYEVDLDGDGTFEKSSRERPETLSRVFDEPGSYDPVVRLTTASGSAVTATTRVVVRPIAQVDALLRGIWTRFEGALAAGNVAAAVQELAPSARERYGAALNAIQPALPEYVASLSGPLRGRDPRELRVLPAGPRTRRAEAGLSGLLHTRQ